MTEQRRERPPQLVRACSYLGMIGVFHVVQVIIVLTGWYSASGEDQVKRFTDPLVNDGINRGDAETVYRIFLAILAIFAASVVVFAVYTTLGQAVSRVMLTITAPLMALLGVMQGSFVSVVLSVVALFFVLQLWKPDINRWFALLSGKEQPVPVAASGWPPPLPPTTPDHNPAPPQHGTEPYAPPQQWATHPQAYAQPRTPAAGDPVKVLSLIALIVSSVVAAGCAFYLLMYEFAREELVQQQLDSELNWMNLTEAEIRDSYHDLAVLSWVVLPLCLIAIGVSAVLLVRRSRRG